MNKMINLKNARLPKMMGELVHSNQFLKLFALISIGMTALMMVVFAIYIARPPIILTLAPSANILEQKPLPNVEDEIKVAITTYITARYNWTAENIKLNLKESENFILPQSKKAFQVSMLNLVRFSTEKQVAQRVYPDSLKVNINQKSVFITGDRVTTIQSMKAAGTLKLELFFESGPRTKENPWGIYITKEREEQQ